MPILTEGAEEAEAVAEEIKANSNKRYRIRQHKFEVGKDELIRFVTDRVSRRLVSGEGTMPGWITADTHGFIPTKDKPDEYPGQNWPKSMWAVCRRDRMFRLRDPQDPRKLLDEFEDGYGDCYIHDTWVGVKEGPYNKDRGLPDAQVYALAVLREPVFDSSGKSAIGFKDQTVEWTDPKGNVLMIPKFIIISQKWTNFYAPVAASCYVEPRTATNKDFVVKRPDQKEYTITPVNLDPSFMHGTQEWAQAYEAPLAAMEFDLRTFLLDHASLDHYKRWFIPGAVPEGGYARKEADTTEEEGGTAAPGAAAPATPQIDQAQLEGFKASLAARSGS